MFRIVLVPLDGSLAAERAAKLGLALATPGRSKVVLLRVPVPEEMLVRSAQPGVTGWDLLWPDQVAQRAYEEAESYLKQARQRLTQTGVEVAQRIEPGEVAQVICDVAEEERADLIVLTLRGRSGISSWVPGNVAERALRRACCPVLLLRGGEVIRHVLIPLDGSTLAERALVPGLDLARTLGARVTLLQAVELLALGRHADGVEGEKDVEPSAFGRGLRYLERVAAGCESPGTRLDLEVVPDDAASAILDFARQASVDLIAMATHGRTGLSRWVYGSVAESVLRGSEGSLLVVPPGRRREPGRPVLG